MSRKRRGLAAAGWSEQRHQRSALDDEVGRVDGDDGPIALGYLAKLHSLARALTAGIGCGASGSRPAPFEDVQRSYLHQIS